MALLTAAEARLLIPGLTGTGDDTKLDTLIAAAGHFIAAWAGWPAASAGGAKTIENTAHTLYLTGEGGRALHLPLYPIASAGVTTIHDDSTWVYGSGSLVAAGDYGDGDAVDSLEGVIRLDWDSIHGAWSNGVERAIKVVAEFGWDTVPEQVKLGARMIVKGSWDDRNVQGRLAASVRGHSESFQASLVIPPEALLLLQDIKLARGMLG